MREQSFGNAASMLPIIPTPRPVPQVRISGRELKAKPMPSRPRIVRTCLIALPFALAASTLGILLTQPCILSRFSKEIEKEYNSYSVSRNQRLLAIQASLMAFRDRHDRFPHSWQEWLNEDSSLSDLVGALTSRQRPFVILHGNFARTPHAMLIGEPGFTTDDPCYSPNNLPQSVYGVFNDGSMDTTSEDVWPPPSNDVRLARQGK